jgi:asparagine synthase (glutamine-hydrolysing)
MRCCRCARSGDDWVSAIAGLLFFDGAPVPPGLVDKLTQRMASAGPDAQDVWVAGSMALGHCLLRTTPEARIERQPLASRDGRFVLAWDGRLDNRVELRDELEAAGRAVRDDSDAELALQAFTAWGADCPRRFLGDFAFAVFDCQEKTLFCARDHVGARPFFYVQNQRFFAFASEDEPLVTLPGVSAAIHEERVAHLLVPAYRGFDHSRSWLKDVRAIGAGESMTIRPDGTVRSSTYWRFEALPENRFTTDEDCIASFRELFDQAVRCRMRSDGDVALMLSGGLDSSAVLATAQALGMDRPLHTYSVVSDEAGDCIETHCIREATRGRESTAHFLAVPSFTGIASIGEVEQLAASRPHPIDHSLLLPALMCRSASKRGHRVMLTGVCGDLTTHGTHDYIASLVMQGRWREAWRESHAAAAHHTYLQGSSPIGIFLERLARRAAPRWAKTAIRAARSARDASLRGSLVAPGFAERIGVVRWLRDSRHDREALQPHQAHLAALAPPYGLASSLGGYHRVAARSGVEIRDPWADRRVVEFWLRLPLQFKFRNGWTKYLARRAFAGQLPETMLSRIGKEHVGWNFLHRLVEDSRERTRRVLVDELGTVDNFVDRSAARDLYRRYLATGAHREREKIFDLLTLIAWVKHCQNIQ